MQTSKLFYKKFGNGPYVLILFHGFGQNHKIFDSWIKPLSNHYTIFSFDLYYHGNSTRLDKPLTKAQWKVDFKDFLEKNNIDQCAIGAFSLGGRFAILTAAQFPKIVKHLILVAPDGVYRNPWYKLAVNPLINPFFKYLMMHPDHFNTLLNWAQKLNLTSSSMIRFAQRELRDPENRQRVYQSWTFFKPLLLKPSVIKRALNELRIDLILGEKDSIIQADKVLPKLEGMSELKTHLLPYKHHELVVEAKSLVTSLLNSQKLWPGNHL